MASLGGMDDSLGGVHHVAELERSGELGIERVAVVIECDVIGPLAKLR